MIATFATAALIGVGIGIISGMLGIGGGMIMVPVFRIVFGMSALASTATSLFTIIPTSISGALSHLRAKTCVLKLGVALGIGGAVTSSVGVMLAQISPSWLVMTATALVIAYSSTTMLRKALKMPKEAGSDVGESAAAKADGAEPTASAGSAESLATPGPNPTSAPSGSSPAQPDLSTKQLLIAVGIGMLAGIASGYVGLGGGFIMVPLMASVLNMPMKLTSGTSLIAILLLATPASITQCMIGNVDYVAGIAMACGSIPGAILGSNLVKRLPERTLRFLFSGFLFIAAILLIVKEAGLMA